MDCQRIGYRETYEQADLSVLATHKPLATGDEPYEWVSETSVAPWVVYVLGRSGPGPRPLAP